LTGHERRLANLRPFQKGNTFGKGRPKDLARFGDILMGEFYKTILASLAGKTVNKTQGEMVALEMVERIDLPRLFGRADVARAAGRVGSRSSGQDVR
jgi:hypothetical protein